MFCRLQIASLKIQKLQHGNRHVFIHMKNSLLFPSQRCCSTISRYPGYNQVILSKGKSQSQTQDQFYPIAINFAQLLLQNTQISRYDILKDVKDTSKFLIMEVYNTPDAFQNHVESQVFAQFQTVAEPLLEDPFELEEFKTIYPLQHEWDVTQPLVPSPLSTTIGDNLLVICVTFIVKSEFINDFMTATTHHCYESLAQHYKSYLENSTDICPFHLRMKLIQSCQEKYRFKFFLFTDSEDHLAQLRQTPLYKEWTEVITPMLEKPRRSQKYITVYSPLIRGG